LRLPSSTGSNLRLSVHIKINRRGNERDESHNPAITLRRRGTMRTNSGCQPGIFLTIILFVIFIQGCVEVNIGKSCSPDVSGGDIPPGGCQDIPIVNPWATDSNTWDRATKQQVPVGSARCISGTRCKTSSPGKCTLSGPNCKTWLTRSTSNSNEGTCDCDCP
jgi:hypothetical protein